ncbi:hypothetical protein [Persicobacter psychrovividus]|uniref:Porin n=1 Tax=Persicobacter psychrovividus TaxID=387638 RepID=A0ABN6LBX5_9BACT|nr:hypothetical protein PEPS_29590 [Persicobacter psychrovividus]
MMNFNSTIKAFGASALMLLGASAFAQETTEDPFGNFRTNDKNGINVFEPEKVDVQEFKGPKIRVGGNFNMMFQGMNQSNFYNGQQGVEGMPAQYSLTPLGQDFNLPQANFNIDVAFAPGVTMKLETYLSTRHHVEANVKGGYLQLDAVPFFNSDFLDGIMENVTLKAGLMEINYGDSHFRRSDGGNAIYNPFVANYMMDAFTTELAFEALYRHESGVLGMLGLSNGKLNQSTMVVEGAAPSLYGKLGFDKQLSDDFRFRLTGSAYHSFGDARSFLYSGDRAGSRYYNVMSFYDEEGNVVSGGDWSSRINSTFNRVTAFQFATFMKYKGLELFSTYDNQHDSAEDGVGSLSQFAADLLYRFGSSEEFYVGARYNSVFGTYTDEEGIADINVNRFALGGGWFMTKNILVKAEYVNQNYNQGYEQLGNQFRDANFNGVNVEAVIAF